jgi:hypothetical protein
MEEQERRSITEAERASAVERRRDASITLSRKFVVSRDERQPKGSRSGHTGTSDRLACVRLCPCTRNFCERSLACLAAPTLAGWVLASVLHRREIEPRVRGQ